MDRNKTPLTHKVTDATWEWLNNHGFKPVETEVCMPPVPSLGHGWCADLAGIISPTRTELIEMKLLSRCPPYLSPKYEGWIEKRKSLSRRMCCLVEVKTSRSDFLRDDKWKVDLPVDLAWVALAPGVAGMDEIPSAWGVLVLRGDVMAQVRPPEPRVALPEAFTDVLYEISIRRDHRTRYSQIREEKKESRERNRVARVSDVIESLECIIQAKSRYGSKFVTFDGILSEHSLYDLTDRQKENLRKVYGVASRRTDAL